MDSSDRELTEPYPCGYLPLQQARLESEYLIRISPEEYGERLVAGWRRFGRTLFRPSCRSCDACRSLRVATAGFQPDRSQRRAWRAASRSCVRLEIGEPGVDDERLDLFDRFHDHRTETRGWPLHEHGDRTQFAASYVWNPFPTEEWRYRLGGRLVGLGYVDALPVGLSGIYFVHDPDFRELSLGIFNVLQLIAEAACRGLPHVYLGYHVEGCGSLAYKAGFRPCERLGSDGRWRPFC